MSEADEIKMRALAKLNEYVEGELKYLVDNELKLNSFSMDNMLDGYLLEEEKKAVQCCINQLMIGKVKFYCMCQGIKIPQSLL